MRACNDRGNFRSLEEVLFSKEVRPKGSRQPVDVEKFFELLLGSLIHRSGDQEFLLVPATLVHRIENLSLQQKDRKRLLNQLKKLPSYRPSEVSRFLRMLNARGLPLEQIFGIEFMGTRAHYSRDFARLRHCIGLSDAVYLASKNLGVKVSYPAPVRLSVCKSKRIFHPFHRTVSNGHRITMKSTYVRGSTMAVRYRLILHYLRVIPHDLKEAQLVKLIKTSLVDAFCVQADQERPVGEVIPLFPDMTQKKLDSRFKLDRRGRVRFYKNLLESKSLCAPVGADMIRDAYKKHRESLCRPVTEINIVPAEFLQKLYQKGAEVGEFVSKIYKPYSTSLPNSRATTERSRPKGGAREALKGNREVTVGPRYLSMLGDAVRPEPFVVGLFGPPGAGKTTLVQSLASIITQTFFPHLAKEAVYSRSCSSPYWDGYDGQPIVILDDFGQSLSDRTDLVEFEQLVSVNRFQLNMASLEEKGKIFTSPFIIVTSNMAYGSKIRDSSTACVLEEDMALWRRFHLPIFLSGNRAAYQRFSLPCIMESQKRSWVEKYSKGNARHYTGYNGGGSLVDPRDVPSFLSKPFEFSGLITQVVEGFRAHTDFHENELSPSWRQVISCQELNVKQSVLLPFYDVNIQPIKFARTPRDVTVSQLFPRFPPFHKPLVEAIALPEPLKVRMITKAEADTKCLKPLQRALFLYLRSQPQFALVHGVTWEDQSFSEKLEWIYRIEKEIQKILELQKPEDLWLSGDYTAATDNFLMSVTNALTEGILSKINHEPTKAWVRYEVSPHRIHYPEGVVGDQTSGQLMGSLLSFPLLCLLNDFIVSEAGFEKGKYLINGDDVVALGSMEKISKWKLNAPKVGLDLSIGKNFIDRQFCTVNSQMFWEGSVMHTGKVSCQTRYGKTLSRCFSETQFYYGHTEEIRREFIRRNLIELRKTPRSLDIPCSHGGLALDFSLRPDVDGILAKKVYLYDFLSPFARSQPVPGYSYLRAMLVPTGFISEEELALAGGEDVSLDQFNLLTALNLEAKEGDQRELTHQDLQSFFPRVEAIHEGLRWRQLYNQHLTSYPPLGLLRGRIVYIGINRVGFLKDRVLGLCLRLLSEQIIKGRTTDPDILTTEVEMDTFEEEWLRLFDMDLLQPDGDPYQGESEEDDRYNRLLPEIKEDWSRIDTPPNLSAAIKTLIAEEISNHFG